MQGKGPPPLEWERSGERGGVESLPGAKRCIEHLSTGTTSLPGGLAWKKGKPDFHTKRGHGVAKTRNRAGGTSEGKEVLLKRNDKIGTQEQQVQIGGNS